MAGVSAAAVTKASKGALAPAMVGKRIDADHECAVKYLQKQTESKAPELAPGIDALYERAVEVCRDSSRWSVNYIQKQLKIGRPRAAKLLETMKINGIVGNKTAKPEPEKEAKSPPSERVVSGKEAARDTKKSRALASATAALENPDNEESTIHMVPEDIAAFAHMTLRELILRFGTDAAFYDWLRATKEIEAISEKRLKNQATKGSLISRKLVQVGVIDTFNSAHLRLMKDGAKTIAASVISKHVSGSDVLEIEAYVSDILGSFIRPVKGKISRILRDA